MRIGFILLLVGALGCTPPPSEEPTFLPLNLQSTGKIEDYSPYFAPGSGSITAQAFLTTRGGDVKRAAGRTATIDPATPLAREWYSEIGTDRRRFYETPKDSLFHRARRTTVVDADGRFTFDSLPAGEYIIRTTVTWEVPGGLYDKPEVQGGVVSEVVRLRAGEKRSIVMSSTSNALRRDGSGR